MIALHLLATSVAAFFLTWGVNWFSLIPWRRSKERHWTERARLLYPARKATLTNLLMIPVMFVLAYQAVLRDHERYWLLIVLFAWIGAILGSYGFDREQFPHLNLRIWLHEAAVASLLRMSGLLLLIVGLALMPAYWGWQTIAVTASYVIIQLILTWRLVPVLNWLRLLEPACSRVRRIVDETSTRMQVPVRQAWLLRGTAANAFAVPISRDLLFNKRLVDLLTDAELAAVCAHELGHLTESRGSLFIRVLGSLTFLPLLFISPLVQAFGALGFFLPMVVLLLWLYLFKMVSRRLEVRADSIARGQEEGAGTYARALEKIHEANCIPAVFRGREQTHPHLYDRLLAAGVTPAYPRPAPPPSACWSSRLLTILLVVLVVLSAMASRKY